MSDNEGVLFGIQRREEQKELNSTGVIQVMLYPLVMFAKSPPMLRPTFVISGFCKDRTRVQGKLLPQSRIICNT